MRRLRLNIFSLLSSGVSRCITILILGLAVLVGLPRVARAQDSMVTPGFLSSEGADAEPYALLFITVWGPDNRAVYGVKVRIRRADQKKPHWEVYSDHRGEAAQRLPPGPADYVVSADPTGVKDRNGNQLQPGDDVHVHFDKEERQDIGLHLK